MKKAIISIIKTMKRINNLNRFNDLTKYLENQNYSYEMSSKLSEKQQLN